MDDPPFRIPGRDGDVQVAWISERGCYRVTLLPHAARRRPFIPRDACDTSFPTGLIKFVAERVDFPWLCDLIARHEDPNYVAAVLRRQLFAHFAPSNFVGATVLDFGCGTGASSLAMAALLPDSHILGVELDSSSLAIADRIAAFRRRPNVTFHQSPCATQLPSDIGPFDFVMLSGVYEHLLPDERTAVMPRLWSVTKPGGAIFINQTPHRWFPYEHHSTGLWFMNYLPDRVAHWAARTLSQRNAAINRSPEWTDHLRGGIRGGTERRIIRELCGDNRGTATILQPRRGGLHDRAAYWLACTSPDRRQRLKRMVAGLFRLSDRLLSTVPAMNVDVVIGKRS